MAAESSWYYGVDRRGATEAESTCFEGDILKWQLSPFSSYIVFDTVDYTRRGITHKNQIWLQSQLDHVIYYLIGGLLIDGVIMSPTIT